MAEYPRMYIKMGLIVAGSASCIAFTAGVEPAHAFLLTIFGLSVSALAEAAFNAATGSWRA
ncbi:hypothetical protein SAMN04487881_0013 [Marinobacter sp. es.048]|uniref:hypothetical protein n=1 Tax=Marinobacter sp. es.048 TaxID=1761795 RepID=UPI000B734CCA|nr:hypothetical protein [Marinobacter sp. es.048]SNC59220.1 hypothetical protein SAMN04487881_0013 [Marinobacter sp. es.048]